MTQDSFVAIANPQTAPAALEQAIRALGPASEPPEFWTRIADSELYGADHRIRAIVALFERHVHPPVALGDLARLLGGAPWMRDEDLEVVRALGGHVPVTFDVENTVVVLRPLGGVTSSRHGSAIYLRFEGALELETFRQAIEGRNPAAAGTRLLEIGLPSTDGHWRTLGKP
jgi:hypothetical protein